MKPDIILGTETWLDLAVTDSKYLPVTGTEVEGGGVPDRIQIRL